FYEFVSLFESINKDKKQYLRYYFMICHPGDDENEIMLLKDNISRLKNIEQFQVFTPTPMSMSSSMYWTGLNPWTREKIDVVRDYKTKKKMKRIILKRLEHK
ncbi:MAG: DUF3362 domain-containing protein, partial [Proteobacteria bacterium]|nr:DUF3362 domain-containing protein [Pseudomonadota bacterium]